ncbi:M56 family metallopeptidase [Streptomyces coeruleorubidus]|uniref:M56 family metallopeptidase n=1 Tax=Streptomyces coeruleorubidus TaxID=116188 RepID=UPI00237F5C7E|nr:M56 family metallopeptidase [Streptomyces coeruleorubidus]WDV50194.1 M56 family metallopeptidase [Streptomyces coeruleorubidus]
MTVWHLAVYLPLLFPVAAAVGARPLAERLEPRLATWLLTASALALAALSWAALGVLAVAGVVRLPLAALVGGWSVGTVRAGDPVSTAEAVVAGLVLAAAVVAGVRMLGRRVRALAAAALEAACLPGPDRLVVIDNPAPDAYALPGIPGRIVVSTGMLDALDDADREAMLAHERAHLACHHYAFVAVAQLAATCNPLLRPVAAAVAYTIERWADERAATTCGNRRQVARAIGKAALATAHTPSRKGLPGAVLGLLGRRRSPLATAGPVPRRVAALLAEPRAYSLPLSLPLLPLVAAAAVVGSSALCAFAAAHDLHLLLKLAGAG